MEFWTYYRVIRKRYRIVLLAVLVALVVGTLLAWPHRREYVASVTLTTTSPDESRYLLILVSDRVQATPEPQTALAMQFIQSRTVAERVVRRLNSNMSPWDLRARLRVTRGQGDLITISMVDENPDTAVLLANTYAETAVAYNQEVNRREAGLARQHIEEQLQDTQLRLRKAEDSLDEFKQQHGIVLMDAQVNSEVGRFLDLVNQQRKAALDEREMTARITDIRHRLSQFAPTRTETQFTENPIVQRLRGEMVNLEVQLAIAEGTYTHEHPTVINLKQRIKAFQEALASEVQKVVASEYVQVNPLYESLVKALIDLETQRVGAQAKQAALASVIPEERQKLPAINDLEREYSRLNRDVQILEGAYVNLQNRLNDVRVLEQAAIDRNLVYIVDLAASAQPTTASRTLARILLAGMLGLFGGIGLTLLQHQLDDRVKTAKDAERLLGVPVLTTVPQHNPPFEEAYRLLKTALGLHAASKGGATKALMFTSPRPGSGASTIVYHLAETIARGGKRVIVLDADLRSSAAHRLCDVDWTFGLMDVLTGKATLGEALQSSRVENVRVLPAGKYQSGELPELFSSKAMRQVLNELRRDADVVLVDTPPPVPFTETQALAPLVDGIVLVLAAGQHPRGIETDTKRVLERAHGRILGVVVNKVSPENDDSYYFHHLKPGRPAKTRKPFPVSAAVLVLVALLSFAIGMLAPTLRIKSLSALPTHLIYHAQSLLFLPIGAP